MKYKYMAIEVDEETHTEISLGDHFCGGVVIDGISDMEHNIPILVIRSEEDPLISEASEWETNYWRLHDLVKTVRTTSVISLQMLFSDLGKRDETVQQVVSESAVQLIQALVNAGGVGWVETPITEGPDAGGIFVQTFVLAVPEFKTFNQLPRPQLTPAPESDDGEEQSN